MTFFSQFHFISHFLRFNTNTFTQFQCNGEKLFPRGKNVRQKCQKTFSVPILCFQFASFSSTIFSFFPHSDGVQIFNTFPSPPLMDQFASQFFLRLVLFVCFHYVSSPSFSFVGLCEQLFFFWSFCLNFRWGAHYFSRTFLSFRRQTFVECAQITGRKKYSLLNYVDCICFRFRGKTFVWIFALAGCCSCCHQPVAREKKLLLLGGSHWQ